jgi:hypothetical protein
MSVYDKVMSVYDKVMSVYDKVMSVYDKVMSVYDKVMSVYDKVMSASLAIVAFVEKKLTPCPQQEIIAQTSILKLITREWNS